MIHMPINAFTPEVPLVYHYDAPSGNVFVYVQKEAMAEQTWEQVKAAVRSFEVGSAPVEYIKDTVIEPEMKRFGVIMPMRNGQEIVRFGDHLKAELKKSGVPVKDAPMANMDALGMIETANIVCGLPSAQRTNSNPGILP